MVGSRSDGTLDDPHGLRVCMRRSLVPGLRSNPQSEIDCHGQRCFARFSTDRFQYRSVDRRRQRDPTSPTEESETGLPTGPGGHRTDGIKYGRQGDQT